MPSKPTQDESVYRAYLNYQDLIGGGQITPNWILGGPAFTFAEGGPQDRIIYKVDPEANSKEPLFDVARLRAALTELLGAEPAGQGVPFEHFQFVGPDSVAFAVDGISLSLDLASYTLQRQPVPTSMDLVPYLISEAGRVTPKTFTKDVFTGLGPMQVPESASPDGKWFASEQDFNVVLRATVDGRYVPLTKGGTDELRWQVESMKWQPWSPDGQRLAVMRTDTSEMARIPTIQWLKLLEEATEVLTIPAGGIINRDELFLFDVHGGRPVQVDLGDTTDQFIIVYGWRPDGRELIVARYDRLLTQVEILAADAVTGATRTILTEKSDTWLTNHHFAIWAADTGFWMLPDGSGFIWRSERDGWAHLYHYAMDGTLINRLTQGEFPVIAVTRIDQSGGFVYFQAHGDQQRPYDNHLYRVPLSGGEMQQLTTEPGRHTIMLAPGCDFFVDTVSAVDTPPISLLRRADGELLQSLAQADISRLEQVGFTPSREYAVKAADGQSDIWATVHFPHDFDENAKYPLVECIYAGPQTNQRVMDFGATSMGAEFAELLNFPRALAQLGFLVVTIDGRGTPGRSKAFHDAVYRNWGQFEIDDHAGAIRQLAERIPAIDLGRVGLTGGSWGGQFTFRGLVQAPDVYKCGIAEVPGYDSRAFILYEPYLGMPADNKALYDAADTLALAPQLKGRLLQTGGLNDTGTQKDYYKMSEALIRAGIHHDTMTYPNCGHGYLGASGRYNNELKKNWLIRELQQD